MEAAWAAAMPCWIGRVRAGPLEAAGAPPGWPEARYLEICQVFVANE